MALEVKTLADDKESKMAKWTANRDLFLDKNGLQVEAGDPAAAFLLIRAGRDLTADQMKTHKVKKTKSKPKADADAQPKKKGKK